MTQDNPAGGIERLIERAARRFGGGLHPLEVLRRVETAFEDSARDGVVANDIAMAMHPADFDRYSPALRQLHAETRDLLLEVEGRRGFRRIGDLVVRFESEAGVPAGAPRVTVKFVHPGQANLGPSLAGATRRITRQKGVALVLADGARVPVTHTPFTIGRGPGNDLVLPSLAVSREHAELVEDGDRLALRDRGSRNGITVSGESRTYHVFQPDAPVMLGDVQIWLEYTS